MMRGPSKVMRRGWARLRLFLVAVSILGVSLAPLFSTTAYAVNDLDEFALPTSAAYPDGITQDANYDVWFTERDANKVGKIAQDETITEYSVPTANAAPTDITLGPDEALWFIESAVHQIGRVTLAGVFTEFELDESAVPVKITTGPDGNLWFTDTVNNQVSRMTTAGVVTDYAVPTANSGPHGIAKGPDGYIWFTERTAGKIVKMEVATETMTEIDLYNSSALPTDIALGITESIMWFTEQGAAKIGYIDVYGGPGTMEFDLSDPTSVPMGLAFSPYGDGAWFTVVRDGYSGIGMVNNVTEVVWEYELPSSGAQPGDTIGRGGDGSMWFTQAGTNKLGKVNVLPTNIASDNQLTIQVGVPFEFTVVGEGAPYLTLSLDSGTLPDGVTFTDLGNGTALLAGTVDQSTIGVHELGFSLQSTCDAAHQDFTLNVTE